MNKRLVALGLRLAFAAIATAGVVVQLTIAIRTGFSVVSFFSYFTILSNLLGSAVFTVSAIALVQQRPQPDAWRGAATVYLLFVGLVFNTLLLDVDLGELLPWVNFVHHRAMPLVVLLDWALWPPQASIGRATALRWTLFPVVYVIYSLVRGAATGFYAYPFFDAPTLGYAGVAVYCGAMLVAFVALALGVRWMGRRLQGRD